LTTPSPYGLGLSQLQVYALYALLAMYTPETPLYVLRTRLSHELFCARVQVNARLAYEMTRIL